MWVVGLTGGIGSGKTAASNAFAQLGVAVVDADVVARIVVEPGTEALSAIAGHFGADVLLSDGNLNRPAMRQKIFANADEKQWLESLLHPLIAKEIKRQLATARSPYAILVSPLLLEIDQANVCDRILVVDVNEETQVARTIARDGNDEDQVRRIIAAQSNRQKRLDNADDVIDNSTNLTDLQAQVAKLHSNYMELARHQTEDTHD